MLKGILSLNIPEISFLQYRLKDLSLHLPENRFSVDRLYFQRLTAEDLSGNFDEDIAGNVNLTLYGGKGNIRYNIKETDEGFVTSVSFSIKNLILSDLVRALSNNEVYISGILDVNGQGTFTGQGPEVTVVFRSKPVRGVKQVMNFSAIKVLASLGGGNPIKTFGSSNFGYKLIAGRVTIKENHLTLEGMAGEKGGQDLLVKGGFFSGVNLSIDRNSNTIKIEEIKHRIDAALSMKK